MKRLFAVLALIVFCLAASSAHALTEAQLNAAIVARDGYVAPGSVKVVAGYGVYQDKTVYIVNTVTGKVSLFKYVYKTDEDKVFLPYGEWNAPKAESFDSKLRTFITSKITAGTIVAGFITNIGSDNETATVDAVIDNSGTFVKKTYLVYPSGETYAIKEVQ